MLRASGEAGRAWLRALPRVPGRARARGRSAFAAGAAPTTASVGRFGSGKLPGRGVRLEGFPVGVVEGRSGRSGADPGLALRQPALGYRDGS